MIRAATTSAQVRPLLQKGAPYWLALTVAALVAAFVLILSQASLPPPGDPVPDAPSYVQQAIQMSHGNFLSIPPVGEVGQDPAAKGGMFPSRYPPGYSAALAPFAAASSDAANGVSVGNAFYVWATIAVSAACAALLAGWLGAFLAVCLLLSTTFVWSSAHLVMSDCFGALLAAIGLLAVICSDKVRSPKGSVAWLVVLGAVCGYAVMTRISLIFLLPAALIVVRGWRRRGIVLASSVPFIALLALYQWRVFGSPLKTGYDYWLPGLELFRLDALWSWGLRGDAAYLHVDRLGGALLDGLGPDGQSLGMQTIGYTPPYITYPSVLLGLYWVYMPPLVVLIGVGWLWFQRMSSAARFIAFAVILNLAIFAFYAFMGARLIAPAAILLTIATAAGASELLPRLLGHLRRLPTI